MKKSVFTPEYALLKSILRESRQSAGLTQRDLAARLAVPHSWVAKVESGERRIDLIEFGWFMAACGLDPVAACAKLLEQSVWKQPVSRERRGGGK